MVVVILEETGHMPNLLIKAKSCDVYKHVLAVSTTEVFKDVVLSFIKHPPVRLTWHSFFY